MAIPIKKFLYLAEYALLRGFGVVLGLLPHGLAHLLTRLISLFVYHVLRIRRQVAMANLNQAFGAELGPRQLARICRDSYFHVGLNLVELLLLPRLKSRISTMTEFSDTEQAKRYAEQGRGLVVVSGHLGSWELAAAALASQGVPATVVTARLSNPYVDAMVNRNRSGLGITVVNSSADSLKPVVRAIKSGHIVGLVSDQNSGEQGIFVDFFGRSASTPPGAALLALRFQAPIFVAALIRTGPGRFRGIVREVPVYDKDTAQSLTQRYTTMLEEIIRAHPEQYFWMHKRWKTRPPGEKIV